MKNSKPSSEQVVEAMRDFGHGISSSLSTPLQWWIENPGSHLLFGWLVNWDPNCINAIVSQYKLKAVDIATFKARLLNLEICKERIKEVIPSFATGYRFSGLTVQELISAIGKLGVKITGLGISYLKNGFADHLPTTENSTIFPKEKILKIIKTRPSRIKVEDIKNYCKAENDQMASCEEILDLFLDIAIRAILKNSQPTVEIPYSLYPDNNGELFVIVCKNNIKESSAESQRPLIIQIQPTRSIFSIDPWPVKYFQEGEKNQPASIYKKTVGIIPN